MVNGEAPRRWWQWILVYPAFVMALLGAIPTAFKAVLYWKVEAAGIGVPFNEIHSAARQNKLWKKNANCVLDREAHVVMLDDRFAVSVLVCPAGDVLVQLNSSGPESKPIVSKWVALGAFRENAFREVARGAGRWVLFVSKGSASMREADSDIVSAQGGRTVICQLWIADGLLMVRARYENGKCFDETINTFAGVLLKSVPAPCSPQCVLRAPRVPLAHMAPAERGNQDTRDHSDQGQDEPLLFTVGR